PPPAPPSASCRSPQHPFSSRVPPLAAGVDRADQPGGHLVGGAHAVDGDELVAREVPGDERLGLLLVELETAPDGRVGVVAALDDLAAAGVADVGLLGWL